MSKKFIEKGTEHGKLYQDQLYGTKVLTPLAVAIVDTPEFQRLSSLRQLGFTNVVYRGAEHTRFAHSIGTYLLARTLMRRIVQNHERLGLPHPGEGLPSCYSVYPFNAFPRGTEARRVCVSNQSLWRGLTEVVSAAALLHDITHVPFGHTLEDEFVGMAARHDNLGGSRLYELLFNEQSELRKVFSEAKDRWITGFGGKGGIPNDNLGKLVYVVLSWREETYPPVSFDSILASKIEDLRRSEDQASVARHKRLRLLKEWHADFAKRGMFHPYMSDIIGNTICADLLDYLPRDRTNLGMETRTHARLQRYLTIREGTLYPGEGLRVSIMVTRTGRGGQRRDVATAVMDIMRERYEMAERVFHHHKKAAVSSMLAKLAEVCPGAIPSDDEPVYPAPWDREATRQPSHLLHFSDVSFIDHLGGAKSKEPDLQRRLYVGLRYDRRDVYRTLLVVDTDLVHLSLRPVSYFAKCLREDANGKPSSAGRRKLEAELSKAAKAEDGNVLVYCPGPEMQAKEVDARLEIIEKRVLPLRVQRESFAYHDDVRVLEQYYQELWRMYVFVSPELYDQPAACQAIVDAFCERYGIEKIVAYNKVRRYDFRLAPDVVASRALEPLREFIRGDEGGGLPFDDTPADVIARLLALAAKDEFYLSCIKSGSDSAARIAALFNLAVLEAQCGGLPPQSAETRAVQGYMAGLRSGEVTSALLAARGRGVYGTFRQYADALLASAKVRSKP